MLGLSRYDGITITSISITVLVLLFGNFENFTVCNDFSSLKTCLKTATGTEKKKRKEL